MPYTELYHHGILGQKWGVRRFQNADGSLTSAGRLRYGVQGLKKQAANSIVTGLWKADDTYKSLKTSASETKHKMDRLKSDYRSHENWGPSTNPDIIDTDGYTFDTRRKAFSSGKHVGSQIKTMSDAVNCCYELSTINSILDQYYSGRPGYEFDHKPKQISRNISG